MWEEFTESLTDSFGTTWKKRAIRNINGFTLIAEKMTVENKLQTFICRGDFGEFRFFASRWDGKEDKPADTYIVKANLISGDWNANKEEHRKIVLLHAKEIESALLAFPLGHVLNTPVHKVLFDVSLNLEKPNLARAEEI